jgi:uncharacterized membrane protein
MSAIIGYLAALVAFVAADFVWLGLMVPRLYKPTLVNLMAASVNLPAAIVFYLIAPIGLSYFAITPALKAQSLAIALVNGALFGFFTYATYDLTNQATLRDWTTQLTVVDMAWGCVLGAFASCCGFLAASRLGWGP